ncbi:RagB/SusD family nutrient uptake outer membrane protein [Pedobacter psychrophilus]|nr:RagB/SusD family nutrient uptake outer membrane protein [Pedobacter psychrophilus]
MKNNLRNRICFYTAAMIIMGFLGCKDFLDAKPDKKLVIPTQLKDYQALLDNYPVINNSDPGSGEISSDDYYLTDIDYNALSQDYFKRMHIWEKEGLFNETTNDWSQTYRPVYVANTILQALEENNENLKNSINYNDIKGQALFVRARSFYQIVGLWGKAYDDKTANSDLGIVLRLNDDFNEKSKRSSLMESYQQILNDLQSSISLLPSAVVSPIRPNKAAAYGLTARLYLSMRIYDKARLYADSCLQLNNVLLDFNTLSKTATYPFAKFNKEVIYESMIPVPAPINNSRAKLSLNLYNSYETNDLRKTLFYRPNGDGSHRFKGSYEAGANLFSGIATDEIYLIRAECAIRANDLASGLKDLNDLLKTRYSKVNGTTTYVDFQTTDQKAALSKVLLERRKELLMRGLRWLDVKRLNKEGAGINLLRNVNGISYSLPANDNRFALEIPQSLLKITSIEQNPR